ncbi:unnamed protein product [Rhodiola kirilowii]
MVPKVMFKELMVEEVTRMKDDIVIILCKLEMVFPPAFFTIMVHLLIHLPEQELLKGPVHYNWMFPIERQLGEYKRSVRNSRYLEGCIAERYVTHDCITYCKLYMNDESSTVDSSSEAALYTLNVYSPLVKGSGNSPRTRLSKIQLDMAHWCVVEHYERAHEYLLKHANKFERECPNRTKKERVKHFLKYFRDWMDILKRDGYEFYCPELHCLARMPQSYACYSQCYVNGVKFIVWDRDQKMKTQNSGVMVEDGDVTFYGIIEKIVQVDYANGMPVVVFDCIWFNTDPTDRGSTKRDYGLLSVDTFTSWYEDWPYCLATTARQVFYLDDLKAGEPWKVVNVVSHRGTYSDISLARQDDHCSSSSGTHNISLAHTLISPQGDDPYQEHMPAHITNDVQPASMDPNIEQIPRARRKLILDEEEVFATEDDSIDVDEDDEEMMWEDQNDKWDDIIEVDEEDQWETSDDDM